MYHLRKRSLSVIIVLIVMVGIIGFQFQGRPAQASLGNSGIPVRCYPDKPGQTISSGDYEFFRCIAADGTQFDDNQQRVPVNRYLLITDIVITPDTSDSTPGTFYLTLYADSAKSNWEYSVKFHDITGSTVSEHYTAPYMVLPANYRIEGFNQGSTYSLNIHLAGLLVTNVNYMPLAIR